MDNYKSILGGILKTQGAVLDLYLNCLNEHKIIGSQNTDEAGLMLHITSLLTTSSTRFLGFRLLDTFLDNSSTEVLEKKFSFWITFVLKACNDKDLACNTPLVFRVLSKIIKSSQQSNDLTKTFTNAHISKVYESLTNVHFSKSKYALSCIETCLRLYPGPSSPSRGIIERYLWKNIDHIDYEVVQNCGKCLHLLQQVKGGVVKGINHKTQWRNYHLQLLGSIHSIYNEMFANCTEMYEEKIEEEKVPWEAEQIKFDPEPVKRAAQLYTRCRNLITYLIIALRENFPVEKPIMMKKILNVVVRGLSVNCLMLEQNPIADNIALSIVLPKLHVDLLNLLNVVITVLRGHLRPYSDLILSLMIDTLKWTSAKRVNDGQKTLFSLRKSVYATLSLWCKMFNSGNGCESISEYLFQEILFDITPTHNELTLQVLSGTRKHMSKKARRQLHNAQNEKSNINKTHSGDRNVKQMIFGQKSDELCISALDCLQEIILSVANLLKPTVLKMMQISIIQICAVFYGVAWKSTDLYNNKDCRIKIYNTLYAIMIAPHHLCPPPSEMILEIIKTAYTHDDSLKVRLRCGFMLKNLEKLIHPQKESLLFTVEARDVRNAFIKMGQENLIREFEFQLFASDNEIEAKSANFQQLNTPPPNENVDEIIDLGTLKQSISATDQVIQNDPLRDTDVLDVVASAEDQSNNFNGDETIPEEIHIVDNRPETQEVVQSVDDTNIAVINEEKVNDEKDHEPMEKKLKLSNEKDESEYSPIIQNMQHDEDLLLNEIASQFIDELE